MRIGPFELKEPVPELREPHALAMLRPWVDVGSVGSISLTMLERHLGAGELGKLARPGNFFDFTRYRPTITVNQGERGILVPNTYINYARREKAPDFLFIHMLEPHMFGEDYAEAVLAVMKTFHVKRYALLGAMYDAVPHTRPLQVTGSITGPGTKKKAGEAKVQTSTYQGPTTITYMISQKAPELGAEVASLIVHLPQYIQLEEDYSGVARVLEVLRALYDLPSSLVDQRRGAAQYEEISQAVANNPRLAPVIKQLEATYDAKAQEEQQRESSPLSPEIEDFLRQMDQRFEQN